MKDKFLLCKSVKVSVLKLKNKEWAVMIFHNQPPTDFGDVTVGWYRTRKLARQHAKKIRKAIIKL